MFISLTIFRMSVWSVHDRMYGYVFTS